MLGFFKASHVSHWVGKNICQYPSTHGSEQSVASYCPTPSGQFWPDVPPPSLCAVFEFPKNWDALHGGRCEVATLSICKEMSFKLGGNLQVLPCSRRARRQCTLHIAHCTLHIAHFATRQACTGSPKDEMRCTTERCRKGNEAMKHLRSSVSKFGQQRASLHHLSICR